MTQTIDFDNDIDRAVDVMRRGGVILYPTDTVWGIGCDATRHDAISRIYSIKQRADSKALITLLGRIDDIDRYVDDAPAVALEMARLAVNPLTIVYDHPVGVDPSLLAPDGSLAIRVTSERYSAALCRRLRRPVVSTSANISGNPSPATFADIDPDIINAVDYVAFYRRDDATPARPSSVVKIGNDSTVKILRK